MKWRTTGLRCFAAALYLSIVTPAIAQAPQPPQTKTPIQHFIVLLEEKRSFDSYFGAYPGAAGIPADACVKLSKDSDTCTKPYTADQLKVISLSESVRKYTDFTTLAYYTDKQIPYYWNVAEHYVLFDRYFSSASNTTNALIWNKMFLIAGVSGTSPRIPPQGYGDLQTIFDSLEEQGISWKFYVQDYDPSITFRSIVSGSVQPGQVLNVPLVNFPRFVDDPKLAKHIVDLNEYYKDLNQDTLPAVSYITAYGGSGSTLKSLAVGQRRLKIVMQELMRSRAWDSSALLWTHDGSGGWYDHVEPARVDSFGLGLRVPAMLISPYALRGAVDSTQLEHSSILRFIQYNWGLAPLALRDADANNFLAAFDFQQPPRDAKFLPMERATAIEASLAQSNRSWIFVLYGGVLVITITVFAVLMGARVTISTRKPRDPTTTLETPKV